MKIVEVTPNNKELIKKIYQNEIDNFGVMGGADMWAIMSFIRYGKLYVLLDSSEKLLSVAQYQAILGENAVFLYGFSTLETERRKGYGKKLLEITHSRLKDIGVERVCLTVDPKNIEAVSMYKKAGYEIEELQKDEYGSGIHRYLMTKIL